LAKDIWSAPIIGQGKTKRAYWWAYRSNSLDEGLHIVVFDYQGGRAGAVV
jgi:transposase